MLKKLIAFFMALGFSFYQSLVMALTETQETAIQAGFDANQASGENVGVMVIMFVLALAVIGLIITMVKKH